MGFINDTNVSETSGDILDLCNKLLPNWLCYSLLPFSVIIIVENILFVATIYRGFSTTLSASSYVFLGSLAVADALVGVGGIVMAAVYLKVYPEDGKDYPPSNVFAVTIIIAQTLMIISVIHMAVLAFDRYLYILEPFLYIRRVTKRVINFTIAGTWCVGILTMSLPFFYFVSHQWKPFCEAIDTPTVFAVSMGTIYLIVLAMTVYAYCMIFREVQRHNLSIAASRVPVIRRSRKDIQTSDSTGSNDPNSEREQNSTSNISENNANSQSVNRTQISSRSKTFEKQDSWKSAMKMVKFLLLVFGTFIACTLPSILCLLVHSIVPMRKDIGFIVISLLPLNSVLNFPVVLVRDGSFRKEFKRLVKDILNCVFTWQ